MSAFEEFVSLGQTTQSFCFFYRIFVASSRKLRRQLSFLLVHDLPQKDIKKVKENIMRCIWRFPNWNKTNKKIFIMGMKMFLFKKSTKLAIFQTFYRKTFLEDHLPWCICLDGVNRSWEERKSFNLQNSCRERRRTNEHVVVFKAFLQWWKCRTKKFSKNNFEDACKVKSGSWNRSKIFDHGKDVDGEFGMIFKSVDESLYAKDSARSQ